MNTTNHDPMKRGIYERMDQKETDELLEIWENGNREEWTDMAFDVIKEILLKRLGKVPPQVSNKVRERISTADNIIRSDAQKIKENKKPKAKVLAGISNRYIGFFIIAIFVLLFGIWLSDTQMIPYPIFQKTVDFENYAATQTGFFENYAATQTANFLQITPTPTPHQVQPMDFVTRCVSANDTPTGKKFIGKYIGVYNVVNLTSTDKVGQYQDWNDIWSAPFLDPDPLYHNFAKINSLGDINSWAGAQSDISAVLCLQVSYTIDMQCNYGFIGDFDSVDISASLFDWQAERTIARTHISSDHWNSCPRTISINGNGRVIEPLAIRDTTADGQTYIADALMNWMGTFTLLK